MAGTATGGSLTGLVTYRVGQWREGHKLGDLGGPGCTQCEGQQGRECHVPDMPHKAVGGDREEKTLPPLSQAKAGLAGVHQTTVRTPGCS